MRANGLAAAAFGTALLLAFPNHGRAETPPGMPSLAATVERVVAGVVSVAATGAVSTSVDMADPFIAPFFGSPDSVFEFSFESSASGVIIDAGNGYILTNSHIIENAERILVTFSDDMAVTAEVVGADPATDLAVLRVPLPAGGLTALPLGDSDALRVGDYVLAVGSPFGLSQSVTMGIVSGLGRSGLGIRGFEDFIQTDASINPGNSGGALVDLNGRLVGINSAIIGLSGGNVGVGFAIPINLARNVMMQLIAKGTIRRGELGLLLQNVTPELAEALALPGVDGVIVTDVLAESGAARAGIGVGDVIRGVNGSAITDIASLHTRLGLLEAGTMVELQLTGRRGTRTVPTELDEPTADEVTVDDPRSLLDGVMLAPPGGPMEFRGMLQGALVVNVPGSTAASLSGLRPGDLILEIGGRRILSPEEAIDAAHEAVDAAHEAVGHLLLRLVRGGRSQFLAIKAPA
jgi:Do/DeqQ family serine protease